MTTRLGYIRLAERQRRTNADYRADSLLMEYTRNDSAMHGVYWWTYDQNHDWKDWDYYLDEINYN